MLLSEGLPYSLEKECSQPYRCSSRAWASRRALLPLLQAALPGVRKISRCTATVCALAQHQTQVCQEIVTACFAPALISTMPPAVGLLLCRLAGVAF